MSGLFSDAVISAISGGRRPPAPKGYKLPSVFPSFSKAKRISIDLESYDTWIGNKLGPGWRRDAYIVGFAVALGDKKGNIDYSDYYPMRHKGAQNLDAERMMDWLATELAFYQGEIVGTNLLYDMDGLQYQRVSAPLAKFRDIQWAEALIDEHAFSYGLNTLAKKYLGEGKVKEELKLLYGDHYIERFHEVHPGHARAYGLGDVELPMKILDCQQKILHKENLEDLYDLESRLLPLLLYMRKQGTRVDLKKAAEMGPLLVKRRDDAIAEIAKMSGVAVDYDNFGTPVMMKRIFDKMNIAYPFLLSVEKGSPLKGSEDDGKIVLPGSKGYEEAVKDGYVGEYIAKPSFRKVWLEKGLDHPIAGLIMLANSAEKARGTFVEGYIGENAIGDRIHCEFHPLRKVDDEDKKSKGTITGRLSAANPNLQNIPTRDPFIGPMCRSMFIADEGMQWWSQDYCVAPSTKILTTNLEWKSADAVNVGDALIGFDKENKRYGRGKYFRRKFKSVRVVATKALSLRCVRVTTDKTSIVCSSLHKWLAKGGDEHKRIINGTQSFTWVEAQNLNPGDVIPRLCSTWQEDKSWDAGYLAAAFDGEGSLSRADGAHGSVLAMAQRRNEMRNLCKEALLRKGFDFAEDKESEECPHIRIRGGRSEQIRFLGSFRPPRLLSKASVIWDGSACDADVKDTIVSVEDLGELPVIAIQTDEGTLIVEGLLSSNSQIEYRMLIHFAVINKCKGAEVPQAMYLKNPKTDFHDACAELMYKKEWDDAVSRHLRGEISEKEMKSILKELRKPAKNLNFGMVYGMGTPLLAEQIGEIDGNGKPTRRALAIMEQYHNAAPYIKPLNELCVKEAEEKNFITTILGRRGRFNLWQEKFKKKGHVYDKDADKPRSYEEAVAAWGARNISVVGAHKALNKKLQGSAADLIKLGMVQLWEAGIFCDENDITCNLTVHDELNGSFIPSERGEKARLEVKEIMEHCMEISIPILTSGSVGANWSEAK